MPVLDEISSDYEGDVAFLAIGARSDAAATADRAVEWMPSGRIKWAFDPDESLWAFFGARGTPTTVVLSADDRVLGGWPGEIGEDNLRRALDQLVELGG